MLHDARAEQALDRDTGRSARPTGCARRPRCRSSRPPPATPRAPATRQDRASGPVRPPSASPRLRRPAAAPPDPGRRAPRTHRFPRPCRAQPSRPVSPSQRRASPREASALLPRSLRQRRRRCSRSTSLPPSPRSDSSTAASAASGASAATSIIWARRGGSGSAATARPWAVGRPSPSSASSAPSRARASATAAAGGGSSQPSRPGSASPRWRSPARGRPGPPPNLGRIIGRQAGGRRRLPQPPRRPRPLSRGAAGALGGGGLAHPFRHQPGDARRPIITRPPRQPRIDARSAPRPRSGSSRRWRWRARACAFLATGAIAARCSPGSSVPCSRWSTTSSGSTCQPLGRALDLRHAGQEGEQPAFPFRQRAADGGGHLVLDPRLGARGRHGGCRAGSCAPRSRSPGAPSISAEKRRPSSVADMATSRRSGLATPLRIERQRQPEIAVEAALMHLVEQHGGDARQLRIGLDAVAENPLGEHEDARRRRLARCPGGSHSRWCGRPAPRQFRHALGRRPRGEAARDSSNTCPEHQASPQQGRRHGRRLARPRRRDEHRTRSLTQRGQQIGQLRLDRQGHDRRGVPDPISFGKEPNARKWVRREARSIR